MVAKPTRREGKWRIRWIDENGEMDNPRALELLAKIGDAAGKGVKAEHFGGGAL